VKTATLIAAKTNLSFSNTCKQQLYNSEHGGPRNRTTVFATIEIKLFMFLTIQFLCFVFDFSRTLQSALQCSAIVIRRLSSSSVTRVYSDKTTERITQFSNNGS